MVAKTTNKTKRSGSNKDVQLVRVSRLYLVVAIVLGVLIGANLNRSCDVTSVLKAYYQKDELVTGLNNSTSSTRRNSSSSTVVVEGQEEISPALVDKFQSQFQFCQEHNFLTGDIKTQPPTRTANNSRPYSLTTSLFPRRRYHDSYCQNSSQLLEAIAKGHRAWPTAWANNNFYS
jgi:hypothetical protein